MRVEIIAGPPLAGKTSFVNAHAEDDDLVLDLDALVGVMSSSLRPGGHVWGAALDARDAIVRRLHRGRDAAAGPFTAWLITTSPETCAMWERQFGTRATRIVPEREVIDARLERDNRPADEIVRAVDRWYPSVRV